MGGVRVPALVAGAIFAALLLAVFAGNALIASGAVKDPTAFETPAKIVFFTLFVAFGFSLVPVMVKLVLGFQVAIGNRDLAPVQVAVDYSWWIVGAFWALMALGLAVGLPAAIHDGFFAGESSPAASEAAKAIARMPVGGTLVAAPGMPASRMLAQSTLRVRRGATSGLFSGARYGGAAIFDYRVAGTATTFRRCRYYYITTSRKRGDRIEEINVGISAEKLTKAGLDAAERQNRARLRGDGWRSRDERTWVRGNVVLDLRVTRIDEPVARENPARAGEWIEYVELRSLRS